MKNYFEHPLWAWLCAGHFDKAHNWNQQPGQGTLGDGVVEHLPLAQGRILETRDRVPRRAPGAWSLLLPLPVSLPLYVYHK